MGVIAVVLALASAALPAGTRIPVRMNTSIATARALGPNRIPDVTRVGEPFAASVIDPIGNSCARIDAGAVVHGRVSALAPATGSGRVELALTADSVEATDLGRRADGAAFTGILVGGIFFGLPGVMIGYGAGGGAAAVDVYHERRVEAWLPAGSTIEVELDEPLALPTRRPSC
jgi:hypothetical protein